MPTITFGTKAIAANTGDTVLESLLKAGIPAAYGCRQGLCQACMLQSLDVSPPASAQVGLAAYQQQQNYFLACSCPVDGDMTIAIPGQGIGYVTAVLDAKTLLAPDVMRVVLRTETLIPFRAGQFVNLQRGDGLIRSYSIANQPSSEPIIEFHIRKLPNGRFSTWVFEDFKPGDVVKVSSAQGGCYYQCEDKQQSLLLIGTGTGLAPLYGVIHDALAQGHSGTIELFHGSRDREGLYLIDELKALAAQYKHFHYTPCVSGSWQAQDFAKGRAHDVALQNRASLKGWQVFLCGHPEMVKQTQRTAYVKGASLNHIYCDSFTVSA